MFSDPSTRQPASLAPEHDWSAAAPLVRPLLRPAGTRGADGRATRAAASANAAGEPIAVPGPAGLVVLFVLPATGFDVLVDVEHLLSWRVDPDQVRAAALGNLAAWSGAGPWTEEVEDGRHVIWSDAGEGLDAARILLPEVRRQLTDDLAPLGRILVGLPERDLLMAASLAEGDEEFALMFADYVAERLNGSDHPIERRLFELVNGELVPFQLALPA